MFKHPFSDGMTDDSMFKKVFFQPFSAGFGGVWRSLYIIYNYCHKCHYCHWPLFAGLSSVTGLFPLLSSVTDFPVFFARFVLFPTHYAGGIL